MWFCFSLPNFVVIRRSMAGLWCHIDVLRWRIWSQKSTSGFRFSECDGTCLRRWRGKRLGAYFPQMTSPIVLIPKWHFIARKHVVWAIKRENRFSVSPWVRSREKKTGQDRTERSKTWQSCNNSPIWGEAPAAPIKTKNNMVVAPPPPDIITRAKFQVEIFTDYHFTGSRISHFLIDFCMGLTTVQL